MLIIYARQVLTFTGSGRSASEPVQRPGASALRFSYEGCRAKLLKTWGLVDSHQTQPTGVQVRSPCAVRARSDG